MQSGSADRSTFLSRLSSRQTASTNFYSPHTLLNVIPWRDLKFSSHPLEVLKSVLSSFLANSSAFVTNIGPEKGFFFWQLQPFWVLVFTGFFFSGLTVGRPLWCFLCSLTTWTEYWPVRRNLWLFEILISHPSWQP